MELLIHGDYEKMEALRACQRAKLFNEQAYLYLMVGNREAAIKLLVDNCGDNVRDTLDLAVRFHISDDELWEKVMVKCKGDTKKIRDLMNYSDVYRDPSRFIDTLDDDIEIE